MTSSLTQSTPGTLPETIDPKYGLIQSIMAVCGPLMNEKSHPVIVRHAELHACSSLCSRHDLLMLDRGGEHHFNPDA